MPADEAAKMGQTLAPVSTSDDIPAERDETRGRAVTGSPWLWLALLLIMGLVVPFVPVPSLEAAIIGAVVLTIIYVVVVVQFAAQTTRLQLPRNALVLWFVIALVWWVVLEWVMIERVLGPFNETMREVGAQPSLGQVLLGRTVRTLDNLALLCAAVLGGSLVARLITSPNMMGPICAIIAMIDIWGVLLGGPVTQILHKAPNIAAKAMAAPPTVGAETVSRYVIPQPMIGAGDYLFLGLLFAALHANRMNWRGAVAWTTPLVIVALLAVTFGIGLLPGLLFIGLGVALPNLKYFQYTREEKFALLYAAIFVIILTVALYFGVVSLLPKQ